MSYTTIFSGVHGSQLYGTNIVSSDVDVKEVFLINSLDEYMRQGEIQKLVLNFSNGKSGVEKEETEAFYIQKFVSLILGMNTNNVSMLFTPRSLWRLSTPAWEELIENRSRVLTKNIAGYAGYAASQAQKYTLKGDRLQTAEDFLEYIQSRYRNDLYLRNDGKMTEEQWVEMVIEFKDREGFEVWINKTDEILIRVVGKSFSKTTKVHTWIEPMKSLIGKFGKRAKAAQDDGQDLKALMHAFRICREARELLETGNLIYPTPNREFYLQIRENKFEYEELQDRLTQELQEMYAIRDASPLPQEPDKEWIINWANRTQKSLWGIR